jgi:hypothetical protein
MPGWDHQSSSSGWRSGLPSSLNGTDLGVELLKPTSDIFLYASEQNGGERKSMSRRGKLKPTDSDDRRMNLRGKRNRVIKLETHSVAEALSIKNPTRNVPSQFRPLTIVIPASAVPKKPAKKAKLPFSVGHDHSNSAIRKTVTGPPKNAKEMEAEKKRAAADKKKKVLAYERKSGSASKPKTRRYSILPHDGQPRFEGGIRFFQAGLPELGRR